MIGCANPIYVTSDMDFRRGAKVIFEVLEADASSLKRLLGEMGTFALDEQHAPFSAHLTSLEPCATTIPALALLGKPVMRGVLTVHGAINTEKEDYDCQLAGCATSHAFEKWPAENRNRALWRQHRGPLLKKREKWRTPSCFTSTFLKTGVTLPALIGPTRRSSLEQAVYHFRRDHSKYKSDSTYRIFLYGLR